MKKQLSEDDIKRIFSRRKSKKPKKPNAKELRDTVRRLAIEIKKNGALSHRKYATHPYWTIDDGLPEDRLRVYPHLIVRAGGTSDGINRIGLLKVELDYGRRRPRCVMEKMIGLTGHGLVLCPTIGRFDKFISAYKTVAKTEKIVTDGIYFGLTDHVLQHGILGPTFISLDGTIVQFQPIEEPVQGPVSE